MGSVGKLGTGHEVGLPKNGVGVAIAVGSRFPAEYPMVTRVCDVDDVRGTGDVVRPAETVGAEFAPVLISHVSGRLAEDVGRFIVGAGNAIPSQYSTVAGIGYIEGSVHQRHAKRPIERQRAAVATPVLIDLCVSHLAQNCVGRRVRNGWDGVPNQDSVVPRIGHE